MIVNTSQKKARTSARRADETRRSILRAALEVFCEQTYGGARIEQIAERAGVSVGSIYKHFTSKQSLVNEVFRHWKGMTRNYSFPHSSGMPARERFHGWVTQFQRFAEDHPLANEFLLTHHHAPYLDDESLAAGLPMDQLAVRVIREGQREGSIRPGDPLLLQALVLGVFLGLTREVRARGETLDEPTLDLAERCAWDLLSAHGRE